MSVLPADFSNNRLTFWSSTKKTPDSIELTSFAAKEFRKGIQGFFEKLDPSRVKVGLANGTEVSLENKQIAQFLGISSFKIFLYQFTPIAWFVPSMEKLILDRFKSPEKTKDLVNKLLTKCPLGKTAKLSRKVHDFCLNSSIIVDRRTDKTKAYAFERARGKNLIVGEGGLKKVRKAKELFADIDVAVPVPKRGGSLEDEIKLYDELATMPNIAQGERLEWRNSKNEFKTGMVMPFYADTMTTAKAKNLSMKDKHRCAHEVSEAIFKLFAKGLMHYDLKPDNIFIHPDNNGTVHAYVGDLGGIRKFTSFARDAVGMIGSFFGFANNQNNIANKDMEFTRGFAAPEILNSDFDIWDEPALKRAVIYSLGKTLDKWYGPDKSIEVRNLIQEMTLDNPKARPSIETITRKLAAFAAE